MPTFADRGVSHGQRQKQTMPSICCIQSKEAEYMRSWSLFINMPDPDKLYGHSSLSSVISFKPHIIARNSRHPYGSGYFSLVCRLTRLAVVVLVAEFWGCRAVGRPAGYLTAIFEQTVWTLWEPRRRTDLLASTSLCTCPLQLWLVAFSMRGSGKTVIQNLRPNSRCNFAEIV
jgi:hypothetical protein